MAATNKCDRCGAYYVEDPDYRCCGKVSLCTSLGPYRMTMMDICPVCFDELNEWFVEGKEENDD